jgi:hypothetical protein
MQPNDYPGPCTGKGPAVGTRVHCSSCYRPILPEAPDAITPRWWMVPAGEGHPPAAVCLSARDWEQVRHLAIGRQKSPRKCGGLVSRVTACVSWLFKRGGRA